MWKDKIFRARKMLHLFMFSFVRWGGGGVRIVCVNIGQTFSPLLSCSLTVCHNVIEFDSVSGFLVPCILSRCCLCFRGAPLLRLPITRELDLSWLKSHLSVYHIPHLLHLTRTGFHELSTHSDQLEVHSHIILGNRNLATH